MGLSTQIKSQVAVTRQGSALENYQDVIVGRPSLGALVYYEWCAWLGVIPGALGLVMRKIFWPRMFRSCGKGTVFGSNVSVRHPHRIDIGDRVVISDGCILDARNKGAECSISIGDNCIFSNNVMLSCKNGVIKIGARAGIGAQTIMHAVNNNAVAIGEDVMIGPRCYLAGGGNYNTERTDIPMSQQGLKGDGDVVLEDDIWLGANVTILPGVTMEKGSVAAAGAVVNKGVPRLSIVAGVPAKIIKERLEV